MRAAQITPGALGMSLALVIVAAAAAASASAWSPGPGPGQRSLEIEFIGNMAFRISDGETTLLSDFPYRSGAFGYMAYDIEAVGAIVNGLSLITHEHADHWDAGLFEQLDLRVVADPSITRDISPDRVVPWSDRVAHRGIEIAPLRTEHTAAHHSYLVTWHGLRLYFTGDTENTHELLAQRDLDVAFVSPWLIEALARTGERVDAELLVVYHHTADRYPPEIQRMLRPTQGQVFEIDWE